MSISIATGISNATHIRKRYSNFIIKLQYAVVGVASLTTEEVLTLISNRLFLRLLCHLLPIMAHYYIQDSNFESRIFVIYLHTPTRFMIYVVFFYGIDISTFVARVHHIHNFFHWCHGVPFRC